jgi:hypothetical protein
MQITPGVQRGVPRYLLHPILVRPCCDADYSVVTRRLSRGRTNSTYKQHLDVSHTYLTPFYSTKLYMLYRDHVQ